MGHCTAVVDTVASTFPADLIFAYPDAKIILNTRNNVEAWQSSLTENVVQPLVSRGNL